LKDIYIEKLLDFGYFEIAIEAKKLIDCKRMFCKEFKIEHIKFNLEIEKEKLHNWLKESN
jgi:hypothetical protein